MSMLPAILAWGGRELFGKDDENRQRDLEEQAIKAYDGVRAPGYDDLYQQAGPTEFGSIAIDPATKEAQARALADLSNLGREGYSAVDKAAIQRSMGEVAQQERGQREALMDSARARGTGGSGIALAAQLAAQQGSANRASQSGADIAAAGRARALQALQAGGNLAGQMRGQQWQEGAARAGAQDAINLRNANARQQAAQGAYNNQMGLAGAKSGAARYGADVYGARAAWPGEIGGQLGKGFDQNVNQAMQLGMAAAGMPSFGGGQQSGVGDYSVEAPVDMTDEAAMRRAGYRGY